jgi:hypothetical protein
VLIELHRMSVEIQARDLHIRDNQAEIEELRRLLRYGGELPS